MEPNFEVLGMGKWHIPTNRAQRADEKNGTAFLAACLLPELWLLKCQKRLIFVSPADDSKKLVTIWTKYFSESERSYLAFLENAMNYWVLSYRQQNAKL